MSSSDDNTVRIATERLEVVLRGEEAAVAEAYEALREILVDNVPADDPDPIAETAERESAPRDEAAAGPDDGTGTQPLHEAASDAETTEPPTDEIDREMSAAVRAVSPDDGTPEARAFIQLILRRERYIKVHLLERRDFEESFLGRALDPTHLSRIYADARSEERLRDRIDFGDTVWRRLTAKGRAEVEAEWPPESDGSDRPDPEESGDG